VVLYSYNFVDLYMYVFDTNIFKNDFQIISKLAFELAIICLCDQFSIFLVNTETEPKVPKPNFFGTNFWRD